jgi:hypothetical protein
LPSVPSQVTEDPLWKSVTSISGGRRFVSHQTTQYLALLLKLCNNNVFNIVYIDAIDEMTLVEQRTFSQNMRVLLPNMLLVSALNGFVDSSLETCCKLQMRISTCRMSACKST